MPPLEAWEKVFIDGETFNADIHAAIECTACHGGQAVADMELAHEGLIADPSADSGKCALCHVEIGEAAPNSLHNTLQGYDTALYERSAPENHPVIEEMESYHCDSCHATCGDCHISQPNSVGGGLLDSHVMVETPPMGTTCTACHGSRVKNEYYGSNEGVSGDVHFRKARYACTDCHTADEMHGMGEYSEADHRYDGAASPSCTDCHGDMQAIASSEDGSVIVQHQVHEADLMSCQSCHSVAYTNCTNCHVDRTEDDVPYYSVEEHALGFYLGKNTLQSEERPWAYVPVRHVPVDIDSFSAYGDNLLNDFLSRATWAYATPHNIQRETPQNQSCASCHGNADIFLTEDKVVEAELGGANLDVIVDSIPFPLPTDFGSSELPVEEEAESSDDDF
ncbi:MAG: hypothetical protein JXA10_08325 [Anaerolineae bacterium]|nr:hypothetical protein [Anaerolineae bacterium]